MVRLALLLGIVGATALCACSSDLAPDAADAPDAATLPAQPSEPAEDDPEEDPELSPGIDDDSPPVTDDGGVLDAASDAGAAPTPAKGFGVDGDGVIKLRPTKSGGSYFRLGTHDPNATSRFEIERGTRAVAKTAGKVHFWNLPSHKLNYASGGTGYTTRLHIYPSGTTQRYTWKNEPGYLAAKTDLKDQEFTVYARAHKFLDPKHAAFTLKVRGGKHTSSNGDLASCTMMTLAGPKTSGPTRFGKELTHPYYDWVKLGRKLSAELVDNAWFALKLVTYRRDATHVVYRLYLDTSPFDSNGRPRNQFFLFSEYVDTAKKDTGRYSTLVDWGGMITSFRTDGLQSVDFAIISAREIVPGNSPRAAPATFARWRRGWPARRARSRMARGRFACRAPPRRWR